VGGGGLGHSRPTREKMGIAKADAGFSEAGRSDWRTRTRPNPAIWVGDEMLNETHGYPSVSYKNRDGRVGEES
jgi:hypothetical protein